MAMTVEAVKYRREFVAAFNQHVSLLNDRFTPESMDMGRSAVFDVTAVGGRMAQRSIDGRIPRTNVSDTQVTCTLYEYVKKFEVTDFESFVSQSNEREKMNHRIMESVNQEHDFTILAELANASTSFSSTAAPMTLTTATDMIATLEKNSVPISPNDVTFIGTPKVRAKLMNLTAFTSADYVNSKPFAGDSGAFDNTRKIKNWLDVGWIFHPNLPGVGTSSATCYLVHRRALGVAVPTNQIRHGAGYDDQDHYHYASATLKMGAKILQNAGILKFLHDDTA